MGGTKSKCLGKVPPSVERAASLLCQRSWAYLGMARSPTRVFKKFKLSMKMQLWLKPCLKWVDCIIRWGQLTIDLFSPILIRDVHCTILRRGHFSVWAFLCLERDVADIHPSVINLHVGHCWTGWVDITKSHVHVHSATGCKEGQLP